MRFEVLCTGSELVQGRTPESNAAWIGRRLAAEGLTLSRYSVLPDDARAVADEIRAALRRTRLVILSGGLGPTRDDVTRKALAVASRRPLRVHPEALAHLARWFDGRRIPGTNRRQALLPRGAELLANPAGTAPGIWLDLPGGRSVASVPGVPVEMRRMVEEGVLSRFRRRPGGRARRAQRNRLLTVFGLAESVVDASIGRRPAGMRYGITVKGIRVQLQFSFPASRAAAARRFTDALVRSLRKRNALVLSEDRDLGTEVVRRLTERKRRLAVAESCTGGRIASLVTAVPGASRVFLESVVAYANASKTGRLGVPARLIARRGAVSRGVALAMARGIRRTSGADYGLSATGVAGPDGGGPGKPVGLVWIACAGPRGTAAEELVLKGNRETVQSRAAERALLLLLRRLPG